MEKYPFRGMNLEEFEAVVLTVSTIENKEYPFKLRIMAVDNILELKESLEEDEMYEMLAEIKHYLEETRSLPFNEELRECA